MNHTKTNVKVLSLIMAILLGLSVLSMAGCGNNNTSSTKESSNTESSQIVETTSTADSAPFTYTGKKTGIVINVKDYGTIEADLYDELAPITVENIKKLIGEKFYDGLTFHRIIKGFMIQGGDPKGDGTGGAPDTIKGEFAQNGVENNLSHTRGVLSMARSSAPDSASSQFFIVHQDSTFLDGQYAGFGMVTKGMEVVDKIAEETPVTDSNGTVIKSNQPVIESITLK